jgi:hypothetical protein
MTEKTCITEIELLQLLNAAIRDNPTCQGVIIRGLNLVTDAKAARNWEADMSTDGGVARATTVGGP